MKIGFCELPTNLDPAGPDWARIAAEIAAARADLMVLNEMPFGPWLAGAPEFDPAQAAASVTLHEQALPSLDRLETPVITSRPLHAQGRLAHEAFVWSNGTYRALHQKHYFPEEDGFYERTWFVTDVPGFEIADIGGLRVGVQMCTEMMFNEWARRYGRNGAQLIVAPRASGVSTVKWKAALAMAAAVSGCYVVSSNRAGRDRDQEFGGHGLAYAPGGEPLGETDARTPLQFVEIDLSKVAEAQSDWPCTVVDFTEVRSLQ